MTEVVTAAEAAAAIGHNSNAGKKAAGFIVRIENIQKDISDIMDEAKSRCEPLRDDIKGLKREAVDAGIPRKPLNAMLAARKAEAKAEAIRANLDEDQQNVFDSIRLALGALADTPLGQAALSGGNGNGAHL